MSEILEYIIDVRGGREGKKDADEAAKGFEHLEASLTDADRAAGRFIDTSGRMREANGRFVEGAGDSDKATRRMSKSLDTMAGKLNNVSGRVQLAIGGLLLFGPALLSVAASATAAAGGAAVVGGAGLGALIVSLGGVGIIAKQTMGQLDKVRSAQDALKLSVAQYGAGSKEATNALIKFNAVLDENGGQATLRLLNDLNSLTNDFTKQTGPARSSLQRLFSAGVRGARRLLPSFAGATNAGAAALSKQGKSSIAQLSGPEVQGDIGAFGKAGAQIIGPLGQGLTNLFISLLRVLRPALKYVVRVADAFERWTQSIRRASADGPKVTAFVAMLVGHFKSWWALAKALGETIGILFSSSASSGKGLVDSLTGVVDKMNAWLHAAKDSGRLRQYFDDSANAVRGAAKVIGALIVAVLGLSAAVTPYVALVGELAPLMKPLVAAFVAWKVIGFILELWAKRFLVQMFLLKAAIIILRTTIAVVTAAQWLWNAAMSANPIGLIIIGIAALIGAIVLIVKHWGWFKQAGVDAWNWIKTAAQDAWNWIKDNWTMLLPLLAGPFGALVKVIVEHFGGIKSAFRSALNWIIAKWNGIEFAVPTLKIKGHNVIPGGGSRIGTPDIPLLAEGGNVRRAGSAIVGDAGPEVLTLPEGAQVTPLDESAPVWGGGDIVLQVNRREFARINREDLIAQMART